MPSIRLPDECGFGIQFSPFLPQILACCTSQHYGLKGSGKLNILQAKDEGLTLQQSFDWSNGLFEISWSDKNEDLMVTASGDGSVQLWKTFQSLSQPVMCYKEHSLEASSVDWNNHLIASGSWDQTVKIWHIENPVAESTCTGHQNIVHSVRWSPNFSNLLISCSGDSTLRLWDHKMPTKCCSIVNGKQMEILDCDWSKHEPYSLASCGSDGCIYLWDIRRFENPCGRLLRHGNVVKKLKWSPHHPHLLASASYDLTTILWDVKTAAPLEIISHHSGFVQGVDFNPLIMGQMADCGWDSLIHVFVPAILSENNYVLFSRNKL